jgi:hypothetical protein
MEEKGTEWIAATRKRLREEADAHRLIEEAKKAADEATQRDVKARQQMAKRNGLQRLDFVIKLMLEAAAQKMLDLELGQICFVDFRTTQIVLCAAQWAPRYGKSGGPKSIATESVTRIPWTANGQEQDDLDADVLLPENFIQTCLHCLAAWAFHAGLECSVDQVDCARYFWPFERSQLLADAHDDDNDNDYPVSYPSGGQRRAVIGLRVPLEPLRE